LWQLGGMSKSDPARIRPMIAVLAIGYLGYTVLCGMFFFTAPSVVAAAATLCIALAFTSPR